MRKQRKNYSAQEKVALLRLHLVEKQPVSDLCEKHQLQPTVFYRWLKEFFENGAAAFSKGPGKKQLRHEKRKMEAIEAKLRKKDEVLAVLMEEHVALKKSLGED